MSSQWGEVSFATPKPQRDRRQRQRGELWAATRVLVDSNTGRTLERDRHCVSNHSAAAMTMSTSALGVRNNASGGFFRQALIGSGVSNVFCGTASSLVKGRPAAGIESTACFSLMEQLAAMELRRSRSSGVGLLAKVLGRGTISIVSLVSDFPLVASAEPCVEKGTHTHTHTFNVSCDTAIAQRCGVRERRSTWRLRYVATWLPSAGNAVS